MIDIAKDWAPQIPWYCDLFADHSKLPSAFNQEVGKHWTSVTVYDELSCLRFDDLSALEQVSRLKESELAASFQTALTNFAHSLEAFERMHEEVSDCDFDTTECRFVKQSATAVLDAAKTWIPDAQTH